MKNIEEHKIGFWTVFIYIEIELKDSDIQKVKNILEKYKIKNQEENFIYHISLSKTVQCKYEEIEEIIKKLSLNLNDIKKFQINFKNLKVFDNDKKDKKFVSLLVNEGNEDIIIILNQINLIFENFNFETYYDDPIPHFSFSVIEKNEDKNIKELEKEKFEIKNYYKVNDIKVIFGNTKKFKIKLN
jgi:2'-5' RNA ligase